MHKVGLMYISSEVPSAIFMDRVGGLEAQRRARAYRGAVMGVSFVAWSRVWDGFLCTVFDVSCVSVSVSVISPRCNSRVYYDLPKIMSSPASRVVQ